MKQADCNEIKSKKSTSEKSFRRGKITKKSLKDLEELGYLQTLVKKYLNAQLDSCDLVHYTMKKALSTFSSPELKSFVEMFGSVLDNVEPEDILLDELVSKCPLHTPIECSCNYNICNK